MTIEEELKELIRQKSIDIYRCVDISDLPAMQTRNYSKAIIIGLRVSPEFINDIYSGKTSDIGVFSQTEHRTDILAEEVADFLNERGYKSYAQSENNLGSNNEFNFETKRSPLPHKTIAVRAGLGFIGKDNLLVTKEYGSAVCLCTILTNADLTTHNADIIEPKCGECNICSKVCPPQVLTGQKWSNTTDRDKLVNVHRCECCLKCMANCPWTRGYINKYLNNN